MFNKYQSWFSRVVWFGILANWLFAFIAIFISPTGLVECLKLGSLDNSIWLYNYCWLLILLSCFYIPAAKDPHRYRANAWLLIAGRLVPAATFFVGVAMGFMPTGFLLLGLSDGAIGLIEWYLLHRLIRVHEGQPR